MACFLVPTTEAIVTTIAAKVIKKKESSHHVDESAHISLSQKIGWLNKMLWGGSALLAFEHVWHGEVQPFFPFLTAAGDPESAAAMLHEMATSGTAMAAVVTLAWAGICAAVSVIQKRSDSAEAES